MSSGVGKPKSRVHLPLWASHAWHALHVCGNAACVNPNHLMPGTEQDNADDAVRHGRVARGERHGGATLTDVQRQWVIDTADTVTAQDAARRVGCSVRHVQDIRSKDASAHLHREAT